MFLVPPLFVCVSFIVDSGYSTHVDYDSILFNCQLCKFEKLNDCEFVNYLSHELTNDQMNDFFTEYCYPWLPFSFGNALFESRAIVSECFLLFFAHVSV